MNKILPKKYDEFLEKGYWDKFFNKLKKNSDLEYFEWYGEYKDFASILQSHISKTDTILNIGCGKSLLSEQMYDTGYESIVNIDFSEKVVEGSFILRFLYINSLKKWLKDQRIKDPKWYMRSWTYTT